MKKLYVLAAVVLAAVVAVAQSPGSSHREAPNIMLDPTADNTDTYAFVADDAPDALTVVANWVPGGNPANGPNFFRFDDRARYYISIDNTGEGQADIRYRFEFKTKVSNETFLYADTGVESIDDPRFFQKQRYKVTRETFRKGKRIKAKVIARDLPVAPSNAGPRTFPDYNKVANEAIRTAGSTKLFVGQRNDAFFIDLGAAFDNINVRQGTGNTGGGIDTQSGTSIQTITMQIPDRLVTRNGKAVTGPDADNATVGVWASTERRKFEVTNARFSSSKGSRGGWVQVSRLGVPLINELFLPAGLKDRYNRLRPTADDKFVKPFVLEPELARQLNNLAATGLAAPDKDRTDLVEALLTGMPGLNQINEKNALATDTLKLNLGIPPAVTPNRFGVIGGDNAGFPNGRRLEDDAVDIVVQLAGGFLKGNRLPLGDGVDRDDQAFLDTFPYQSVPNDGLANPVSDRTEPTHAPTLPGNNPPIPGG
ncbi:MAG: DUF4331 domain-containing protein [Solirubrobacteraceae bacterium]